LRVQNLNGRVIAFSKNGDEFGHVSRVWFHLLTGESARKSVKRKDFVGARDEELRAIVNGNRAMSKGY